MLSYKHGFHAGNFADVLKHLLLIYFIKSKKKQYNSITYIDTHAGSGSYLIKSTYMSKNKEYLSGLNKVLNYKSEDPNINYYKKIIREINKSKNISFYPGSPAIANYLTDKKDELYFYELHNNEFNLLKKNFSKETNIKCIKWDGFKYLDKLKNKGDKDGLILIDPSYEIKEDYHEVIGVIKKNYSTFKNKVVLIWYPVLNRTDTEEYIEMFKKIGIKNILRIEVPIKNDNEEREMTGSGLIVLNSHEKTRQNLLGTIKEIHNCLKSIDCKERVKVHYFK